MLNRDLNKLAKTLSLTDDQTPDLYILTPEDEAKAMAWAIEEAKKFMAWKMRRVLKTQDEILHKLALIDWDEKINRQEVLQRANAAKMQAQWQHGQRKADKEREIARLQELAGYWTYGRVYKLMKHNSMHRFGKPLDETADNLLAIKALCFFIARDDRFADELGFDRLKGLLIRGPSDTGKTHLVRCVEDNGLNPILSLSMLDITEQVKENGKYKIENKGNKLIYLDDVGTEVASVKHFGTDNLWFKNFIETVYHKTKCFNHLIITTNLNFTAIGEQYTFRVESRMREMFNVIDLKGGGYRNKKST
jgi:DNA replication protein DnaC